MKAHCYYCDNRMIKGDYRHRSTPQNLITRDHIIPKSSSMFGRLTTRQHLMNIVNCCHRCNNLKGDTPPVEWLPNVCKRNAVDYRARLSLLGALENENRQPA